MKTKILLLFITCFLVTGVQAQIDRTQMPEPGPAPEINLEKPETFSLDNGMKVLVVEDHKLPLVTARLIIDNKPHAEEKPGTAALVSALLGTGTEKIEKDAYHEEIDFMGATVNFGSESAYASSLTKFFPRVFELMAAGALRPNFTQQEFEDQKKQLIESLQFAEKDVSAIASRVSDVLAYGADHPYGEFATPESVESITLEDVKSFYETYFAPENAYLVVIGDIDDDKVQDLTERYFEAWNRPAPPASELPAVTPAESTQIDLVNMPNAVQSELRVQNLIELEMSDEDYFPLLVANQILGGSFGSYLNMNLREEHGFTYGARSGFDTDEYGAAKFIAMAGVRNAVTDSAVVETLKEINRIKNETVTDEALDLAKSKFAGNFVLALERPSTVANYALNIETRDLDDDFYENYLKSIEAVTAEDVRRVANKYIKTDNMRIIVVGKGSDVAGGLENIEALHGEDIPVVYFDKFGNRIEKPVFDKPIPEGVTAENVLQNYIEAIGGEQAVEGVNTLFTTAQADVQGRKLGLVLKTTKDGKSLVTVSMGPNVLSKQVFTGDDGYMMARGQKIPFTPEQIEAAKAEAVPFPELNITGATLLGIEPVNGEDAYVVQVDENTTNYYSVDSGLKLKSVKTVSQGEQTMSMPTVYSNYKEVNGIKFPFTIAQSMGPQTFQFDVTEVKINEGVTDADFE